MRGAVIVVALGTAFGLSAGSCARVPVPNEPANRDAQKGWRPAGIPLSDKEIQDGGVGEVVTLGPWILAMAGYGNLYLGKEGDPLWRKVAVPDSEPVSRIHPTPEGVFLCGVVRSGRVYSLEPETMVWADLGFPQDDSMRVMSLASWGGRYVALLSKKYGERKPVMSFSLRPGDLQSMDSGWPVPNSAITSLGHDSVLLAGTFEEGLYRYTVGDPVWRKLPPTYFQSPSLGPQEISRPRSLAWLGGKLWVGQLIDGLYSTTNLDSAIVPYPEPDSLKGAFPDDLFALLAWRDRLYIGGAGRVPMVLDPSTGRLRAIRDNYCLDVYGQGWVCSGSTTWELAATTDTLYAAAGGQLLKIGYPDIPQ